MEAHRAVLLFHFFCDGEKKMVRCMSGWAFFCLAAVAIGCDRADDKKHSARADSAPVAESKKAASSSTWGPAASAGMFTEITGAVGLDDKPQPWTNGFYVVPELTPGGVALFDF